MLAGIMIDEIDPRDLAAAVIVTLRERADEVVPNPHGTMRLEPGHRLVLVGRPADRPPPGSQGWEQDLPARGLNRECRVTSVAFPHALRAALGCYGRGRCLITIRP